MKHWVGFFLVLMLMATPAWARNTHSSGDSQTEMQAWFGDNQSPYIHSGCLPTVPGASLTLPAFACTGYVRGASSDLVYTTQAAAAVGPLNAGDGTYWVALHRDTSTAVASWTRQTGTAYLWRQVANQPATPAAGQIVASVTVAGGVITAVTDYRLPASYARAGVFDVTDPLYGALGDGSTDDATAFAAALTAGTGKRVTVPNPVSYYKIGSALTIPANTALVGVGKRSSKIQKAFNGDLFTMKDGAELSSIYLDGDGDNFTGKALVFGGTDGRQVIAHCRIISFQGAIMDIATLAGSQMSAFDVEMSRWDIVTHATAVTGSALYAVVIDPTQNLAATPRKFSHIESRGSPAFDFGGSNDTYLSDSFVGDMLFQAESRGVHVANTRWANQTQAHLAGHNNTIVGSGIAPELVLDSGTDDWAIVGNSLNNGYTDNSLNGRNRIERGAVTFTPGWDASSGTQPALGNGTLRGLHSRSGSHLMVTIDLVMGTTTTFGSAGVWRFSLPNGVKYFGDTGFPATQLGSGYARQDSTGNVAILVPSIVADATTIVINLSGTGGQVTFNQPWAWASSDLLRFTIIYDVGN